MRKGNSRVGLKSTDLAKRCECGKDNCECEATCARESRLVYKDAAENADIQYVVDSDRVKENIIIKERGEKYEYDFELSIENLALGVSDDARTLELKDAESGEVKFYIPAPYMYDAAGAQTDGVYYELAEQTEKTLKLKVVADSGWINAEERAFPVTVDPQIVEKNSEIFRYEYYQLAECEGSNGTFEKWEEREITEDSVLLDEKTKLVMRIDKSVFPYIKKSIVSAKLRFCFDAKFKYNHGQYLLGCNINDEACLLYENGVTLITALIPAKNKESFSKWVKGIGSTIDEKSKQKAYELFESGLIDEINDREMFMKGIDYSYYYEMED